MKTTQTTKNSALFAVTLKLSCAIWLTLLVACGDAESRDKTPVIPIDDADVSEDDATFDAESDSEVEPFCGDGQIDEGEDCDDGNQESRDGCSDFCAVEMVEIVNLSFNLNDSEGPCEGGEDDDCYAQYSMTFKLSNFTDATLERVTSIKFQAGTVVISSGGTVCDHPYWTVLPHSESGLLDVSVNFVAELYTLFSECRESRPLFYWETDVETTTDYFKSGEGRLLITGTMSDGQSFATEATADLIDLR